MIFEKIKSLLKIVLTQVGLKKAIVIFLRTKLWNSYLYPLLLFFQKFYLRLKYYKLFRFNSLIPTKHLIALDVIEKLDLIYKTYNINFFLIGGQLLGAVRQESMAGRPSDIDLGLIDTDFEKFYKNIDLIKKNFKTNKIEHSTDKKKLNILDEDFSIIQNIISKWVNNSDRTFFRFNEDRIQFRLEGMLVDIAFFSIKKIDGINYWAGEKLKTKDKDYIYFKEEDLRKFTLVKLYNLTFNSPKNNEKYLETVYGKNWRLPTTKQFIWKKKF